MSGRDRQMMTEDQRSNVNDSVAAKEFTIDCNRNTIKTRTKDVHLPVFGRQKTAGTRTKAHIKK